MRTQQTSSELPRSDIDVTDLDLMGFERWWNRFTVGGQPLLIKSTYDAVVSAATQHSFWDSFEGRAGTVSASERYVATTAGGTTPTFDNDATTGETYAKLGVAVNAATDKTTLYFAAGTFSPRAAEDWGFKFISSVVTAPVIGAGDLYYRVGFHEGDASGDDGVFFRSQDSGNWFLVCRNAATETAVDMGVAPTSTRLLLEFRITGDGASVQGYVNNAATGVAITTNIPTNQLTSVGANVICDTNITTAGQLAIRGWGLQSGF